VGVVILATCPATSEGDLLLETVAVELVVDELGAVVGIDAQQREWQALPCLLDGVKDMNLGFVGRSNALYPSYIDICETECSPPGDEVAGLYCSAP